MNTKKADALKTLLVEAQKYPLLTSHDEYNAGIFTIHNVKDADHMGFGCFVAPTAAGKVYFDGGGAMLHINDAQGGWAMSYCPFDGPDEAKAIACPGFTQAAQIAAIEKAITLAEQEETA